MKDRSLEVAIVDGELVIRIGVHTIAHAVTYAEWANPYDDNAQDYVRTFAIEDANEFAADVLRALCDEREDGSTLLTEVLDKASEAAVNDGSLGLSADEQRIAYGQTIACESTWAGVPPHTGGREIG